jgi:hypothetical protein
VKKNDKKTKDFYIMGREISNPARSICYASYGEEDNVHLLVSSRFDKELGPMTTHEISPSDYRKTT